MPQIICEGQSKKSESLSVIIVFIINFFFQMVCEQHSLTLISHVRPLSIRNYSRLPLKLCVRWRISMILLFPLWSLVLVSTHHWFVVQGTKIPCHVFLWVNLSPSNQSWHILFSICYATSLHPQLAIISCKINRFGPGGTFSGLIMKMSRTRAGLAEGSLHFFF